MAAVPGGKVAHHSLCPCHVVVVSFRKLPFPTRENTGSVREEQSKMAELLKCW